jgi:acyl-CoA synthetase (AMP-forming)/AMP-acid ligase II
LGRADHVLITGGENVDPEWVEQLLGDAPGIQEIAISAIDSPRWGQEIVALVVLVGDSEDAPISARLEAFARASLPSFAVPKGWRRVERIPRLGIAKVDRIKLPGLYLASEDLARS